MNETKAYISLQSKISERLHGAEVKLEGAGYNVVRRVREDGVQTECFGLQVFGDCLYDLEKLRSIVGSEYKILLNINTQQILIR